MYDVYTSGRYEFTTSSDLENFSVIGGISMDFTPRHGTVIPITREETRRLVEQWGYGFDPIPEDTATALQFVPLKQDLLLWPLPAKEQLHFGLNGNNKAQQALEVLVTGLDGRLWIRELKARNSLDCSSLPAGSYILRLETEDRTHRAVFIKK
jgi:hypothetical protein